MTRHQFKAALITIMVFAWFSSCAHLARSLGLAPKSPDVELTGIKIKSISLSSVDLEIQIEVINQDPGALEACELRAELRYEDQVIGRSALNECVKIESGSRATITAPVSLETKEVLRGALALAQNTKSDKIRTVGSLRLKTWLGFIPLTFDRPLRR